MTSKKDYLQKKKEKKLWWNKHRTKIYLSVTILFIALIYSYANITKPYYEEPNLKRPFFGKEDSNIVIKEYMDLECPACRAAHPTLKKIKTEYEDIIRFEAKHFPLYQIHPNAIKAAQTAECAHDQGKYFEMIDLIFQYQENIGVKSLKNYATFLELDQESFNNCLDSNIKIKYVEQDMQEGLNKGVRSTPTIYINGKKLERWDYESLKNEIESRME